MSTAPVLVLGAHGNVGRPLVQALLARGLPVRAASRSGLAPAGAQGVVFDYERPDTHAAAFDGIERAYVMLPAGSVDVGGRLGPVLDALIARRVKVVFQSVLGVDADDSIPYRQLELKIERSGLPFVILRPNWFSDNFHTFWKAGIDHGVIALPAAQGASSFIDARDIAEAAAAALASSDFDGQAFNLTGPQALSYAQAADRIGAVLGRPVRYEAVDDAAFVTMLTGAGVPADYAGFLASIFHPVREGWTAVVTPDVQRLTGHPARSLDDYLAAHAAALKA